MKLLEKKKWRALIFSAADLDGAGAWCISNGASGTSFESGNRLQAFFELSDSECSALLNRASDEGLILVEHNDVPVQNWVQECEELWRPLKIGQLTIQPVLSVEDAPSSARAPGELRLVPGFGFGTGHHATTAMVLEALQSIAKNHSCPNSSGLDVGTGSGLLAIGMAELMHMPVVAFDIDYGALENAAENVGLNRQQPLVSLVCSDIRAISGSYDVVVANLYAEVLETIKDSLLERLKPGAHLVLSGIAASLMDRVRSHFAEPSLVVVSENFRDGWGMLWFQNSQAAKGMN